MRAHFRTALSRGAEQHEAWLRDLKAYREVYPQEAREFDHLLSGELPAGWEEGLPSFPADSRGMATRVACGKALAALAPQLPSLLGGSADLDPSTHSALKDLGDVGCPHKPPEDTQGMSGGIWGYGGRNIHFGVREHAMGSVLNGLAAHGGTIPYGATFLIFSDYMRPPIRLAALMRLGVIYLFTHDSIAVGEDGPTHQPVEQLANLRAVPGLTVIRPADANEVSAAIRVAVESRQAPVALILSRQDLPVLDREVLGPAEGLRRGAYVLAEADFLPPDAVLVASGSEVGLALAVRDRLAAEEIHVRVVSMPSWELFDREPAEYRETVLPRSVRVKVAIEAAGMQGWERYLGENGLAIGVEDFGASAPGDVVLKEYGLDAGAVTKRVLALLRGPEA